MSNLSKFFSSFGLLVGTIVGAGMFAIPYAVVKAGIVVSLFHLAFVFCVLLFLYMLYGEIVFETAGRHRLPGYARIYLGKPFDSISLGSAILGFYGSLLAYGILGGEFLRQLAGANYPAAMYTFMFFAVGGFFLLNGLKQVGEINFFLIIPLAVLVLVLFFLAAPHADVSVVGSGGQGYWFLPYGVLFFAFAGASAIPDAANIFGKRERSTFRRVVWWSMIASLVLYGIFVYSVAGVSGGLTSKEAISGLSLFLGENAVLIGALIGFLAVFTSFIGIGLDLKNIFIFDYGMREIFGWFLVLVVPALLFALGVSNLLKIIGLVGGVAIGIDGITILLIALQIRRRRKTGLFAWPGAMWVVAAALLLGALYEVAYFALQ